MKKNIDINIGMKISIFLIALEYFILFLLNKVNRLDVKFIILAFSFFAFIGCVIIFLEIIRDIKKKVTDIVYFLWALILSIIEFSAQYFYLNLFSPDSFSGNIISPVSYILNSISTLFFSPLFLANNIYAEIIILLQFLLSIVVITFILGNKKDIKRFFGKK